MTAGIAQLVEHNLAKVGVASSSLVSRSRFSEYNRVLAAAVLWLQKNLLIAEASPSPYLNRT
jgi:hypothetical protein